MPAIINSDDGVLSGSSGLKTSGANDGLLNLQTNGSTAMSVNASQQVTFNNTANLPNTFGFKNRIINGGMVIDQRNAGASVTPTTSTYTVDRWQYQCSVASKMSVQQNAGGVTSPAGFSNYLGFTTVSAYTAAAGEVFAVAHKVEGFNFADLNWGTASAVAVTLSFWVRSSITGTHSGSFTNSAGTRSYPFTFTVSAANTWEYKNITVAGDTSGTWVGATNGVGVILYFDFGSGSTFRGTAGSWAAANFVGATGAVSVVGTNGATFYITGVQLERGSTATSFDFRPYGTELALCQRYFCKTYNIADATGTNTSNGWMGQQNGNNGQSYLTWFFPVRMRAAPTITYQANGTGSLWYDSAGGFIMTPSTVRIGEGQVLIFVTGGNSNTECAGHAFASIEL